MTHLLRVAPPGGRMKSIEFGAECSAHNTGTEVQLRPWLGVQPEPGVGLNQPFLLILVHRFTYSKNIYRTTFDIFGNTNSQYKHIINTSGAEFNHPLQYSTLYYYSIPRYWRWNISCVFTKIPKNGQSFRRHFWMQDLKT